MSSEEKVSFKQKIKTYSRKLKLDAHHGIERFAVIVGVMTLFGAIIIPSAGATAWVANSNKLGDTAVWVSTFKTSKTLLGGSVDGVYTNEARNKALVVMHFDPTAKISYNAEDYQAFLTGSDLDDGAALNPVATSGVDGDFYVFGSTGYMGVMLTADEAFEPQIMNLTMRANNELNYDTEKSETTTTTAPTDTTFGTYDQWRVFVNPGAKGTTNLAAMDSTNFDPAEAFYEIVLKATETTDRATLDASLKLMRTNLAQIDTYSSELANTKVNDGGSSLYLTVPKVPESVAGDSVTGESVATATTATDGSQSTLALATTKTVAGGFNFDWRSGNVYEGYLKDLVPAGKSYSEFLSGYGSTADINAAATAGSGVDSMQWLLNDGTDLQHDYRTSDSMIQPLTTVMNNLSQAYQDYYASKVEYQTTQLSALLNLEVKVRDVQSNSSVKNAEFLTVYK